MCQVSELGSYANIHETADIIIDRVSVAYAAHAQDTVGRLFVRKIIDATIKGESSIKFYRSSDVVISHAGIMNPISIIGFKHRQLGRASCRERECQYRVMSVGAV